MSSPKAGSNSVNNDHHVEEWNVNKTREQVVTWTSSVSQSSLVLGYPEEQLCHGNFRWRVLSKNISLYQTPGVQPVWMRMAMETSFMSARSFKSSSSCHGKVMDRSAYLFARSLALLNWQIADKLTGKDPSQTRLKQVVRHRVFGMRNSL